MLRDATRHADGSAAGHGFGDDEVIDFCGAVDDSLVLLEDISAIRNGYIDT